jgi:hypothetical protein
MLFIIFIFGLVMSAQDEVSIVVKCLRLGAADYLVKPLRTNELLNLWTHMWRRRRMVCIVLLHIYGCWPLVFIHNFSFPSVLKLHLWSLLLCM